MTAATPIASTLGSDQLLARLRTMLLIRHFEEKAVELYSAGKIHGFLHLYIGEEAVATGVMPVLSDEDNVIATYREHGQALARGVAPGAIMAEMFGRTNGCSGGRGGSMHLFDAARRFYGGYAIVGGGIPIAVGLALADRLQQRPQITGCFFGDGAVAEGEFHESLNLAALWRLPVLFLCENNYYAMGTALARHQSQPDIARKAQAYDVPSAAVDGMDVVAVEAAAREAADAVRRDGRPFLLELRTYRFRAHSMYDPDLYRPREEIERWKQRDPILLLRTRLEAQGLLPSERLQELQDEVATEIAAAVTYAESGPLEPESDLLKNVYTPAGS